MTDNNHDVVVAGGTPGGIATAVRAARDGSDVLLVTDNDHIGGMMAGGLSYTDTMTMKARTPLLEELVGRVRDHYRTEYGPDSRQFDYCQNGYVFEPHVVEAIFERFVEAESTLSVRRGYYPESVERSAGTVRSVAFEPITGDGDGFRATGSVFVEATYVGDLLAASGTNYRVGRESRSEYDEQFAGQLYTQARGDRYYPRAAVGPGDDSATPDRRGPLDVPEEKQRGDLDLLPHPAGLTEIYPKSTGEGDDAIQAYNYRLCLSCDPDNRRYPEKPPDYDREDYLEALAVIEESGLRPYLLLRYLPNDKADMNSADLAGQNHDYPEADWERRQKIADRHRNYALGLLYFLQNDDAVPDDVQESANNWGLAADEFTDNDNFPWELYVREARRLDGRTTFTENDARHAPGLDRSPIKDDAIAIAEYPLDSHACHQNRQAGSRPEGFFFASQVTRPSQIPYRALLPVDLDNVLVPVPLSATHVAYGTIRLEPTWIHIGEAAGIAAGLAIERDIPPADVDRSELQRTLLETGVMLSFFNECDMSDTEFWVIPVQYLGTKGYLASYDVRPNAPLNRNLAAAWADRTASLLAGEADDPTTFARRVRRFEADGEPDPIVADEFTSLIERACDYRNRKVAVPDVVDFDGAVTRAEACTVLYHVLTGE
jgi:hypothetical protein